jgi:hypothetical protein
MSYRVELYRLTRATAFLAGRGLGLAVLMILLLHGAGAVVPGMRAAPFDLQRYYLTHRAGDISTFVSRFPFQEYLRSVSITDFQRLQADRHFLWQQFHDGDPFLYQLGEFYVQKYRPLAPSLTSLNERTAVGEAFLRPKGFSRGTDEVYQLMGYFFLGTVGQLIEDQIKAKKFDPKDQSNAALIRRLEQSKIYVNIDDSSLAKVTNQVRNLRLGYVASRVGVILDERRNLFLPLSVAVLILSVVIAIVGRHHRVVIGLGVVCGGLCVATLVFLLASPGRSPGASFAVSPQFASTWHLTPMSQYPPAPGGAIKIYRVADANRQPLGAVIWLLRPLVSAQYMAHGDVYRRYMQMRQQGQHQYLLATTGGYTNSAQEPEGLTAEDGDIVNAVLMHDRDGLVVVHDGGIRVLNLKHRDFYLPDGTIMRANPLRSLVAYSQLLEWVKSHKATIFQTHLLAFGDKVTIDPARAKLQLRERRLLAVARDLGTNQVEHLIVNLETPYQLVDAAHEIFGLLAARHKKVEAIINLDVGSYNILEVYDPSGNTLSEPHGPVDIRQATNIIVYWR